MNHQRHTPYNSQTIGAQDICTNFEFEKEVGIVIKVRKQVDIF